MDVDDLTDLALSAVRTVFGRPIVYVPPGGGAGVSFVGDYQRAAVSQAYEDVEVSTVEPRIDTRHADLVEAGITPEQGGLVTFTSEGVTQTWEILDVRAEGVGTTILVLGRQR